MSESSEMAVPLRVAYAAGDPDTLAPDGSEIRLLVDERHAVTRASLCEVNLPAGQVSRPVWHRRVEEIWYVLAGRGWVWRAPPDVANAETNQSYVVEVEPGAALAIPTGWRFQFCAAPDAALRFLCYTAPPWPGPDEAQPAANGGRWPATV